MAKRDARNQQRHRRSAEAEPGLAAGAQLLTAHILLFSTPQQPFTGISSSLRTSKSARRNASTRGPLRVQQQRQSVHRWFHGDAEYPAGAYFTTCLAHACAFREAP